MIANVLGLLSLIVAIFAVIDSRPQRNKREKAVIAASEVIARTYGRGRHRRIIGESRNLMHQLSDVGRPRTANADEASCRGRQRRRAVLDLQNAGSKSEGTEALAIAKKAWQEHPEDYGARRRYVESRLEQTWPVSQIWPRRVFARAIDNLLQRAAPEPQRRLTSDHR